MSSPQIAFSCAPDPPGADPQPAGGPGTVATTPWEVLLEPTTSQPVVAAQEMSNRSWVAETSWGNPGPKGVIGTTAPEPSVLNPTASQEPPARHETDVRALVPGTNWAAPALPEVMGTT